MLVLMENKCLKFGGVFLETYKGYSVRESDIIQDGFYIMVFCN
jgi:hypothetical protein